MTRAYFVAGTDTGVGKTAIAAALLSLAAKNGFATAAIKPVAAGCERTSRGLRNDDALALQAAMTLDLSYDNVNPVALEPAIAPHIAAGEAGRPLTVAALAAHCRRVLADHAPDFTLVEGAGGWRVPLNDGETLADLAKALDFPVILVVGMRLGCINHALLSAEAIERDGLKLAGWVANRVGGDMARYPENLATLKSRLKAPLLGEVPPCPLPAPEDLAAFLSLPCD